MERLTQGPLHKPGHKESENCEPVRSRTFKISKFISRWGSNITSTWLCFHIQASKPVWAVNDKANVSSKHIKNKTSSIFI